MLFFLKKNYLETKLADDAYGTEVTEVSLLFYTYIYLMEKCFNLKLFLVYIDYLNLLYNRYISYTLFFELKLDELK